MKGVVFNLFEDFIDQTFGEHSFEKTLDHCENLSTKVFVDAEMYPDSDFIKLVLKACEIFEVNPVDGTRMFGNYSFSRLYEPHKEIFPEIKSAKEFLLAVDGIIHVEVKKLHKDAELPKFTYVSNGKKLGIIYKSQKRLCYFMEGLIEGCAAFFDEEIEYTQTKCCHKESDYCEFDINFLG